MFFKKCYVCGESKEFSDFHKSSRNKSGLQSKCKECSSIINKKRYEKNKKQILFSNAVWRDNNREKHRASQRKWKNENKALVNHHTALRRAKKKKATPLWADINRIKYIYAHCQWLNKTFNCNMQVDHIVPLNGKNICGLHIHQNLQVIPAEENIKKNNSFLGGF